MNYRRAIQKLKSKAFSRRQMSKAVGQTYHWRELPQVSFLSRQNYMCLSRQTRVCLDKTRLLLRQKYAYTIFLERTREGHRQSDEQWNCFKGNAGEKFCETGCSAYGLFRAHRYHLELNRTIVIIPTENPPIKPSDPKRPHVCYSDVSQTRSMLTSE